LDAGGFFRQEKIDKLSVNKVYASQILCSVALIRSSTAIFNNYTASYTSIFAQAHCNLVKYPQEAKQASLFLSKENLFRTE